LYQKTGHGVKVEESVKFLLADTFTTSLARLTGEEQKLVKTTAFDLQMNPANPGHSFHKLDRAKDPNFWSVRVSSDIRLIVHRSASSLLLCYVDHHDEAYRWAERRKLETHPKTGAAQIVQIRETVREIEVPVYVPSEVPQPEIQPLPKVVVKPLLFAAVPDDQLLSYGVPPDWLEIVKALDEDTLMTVSADLPSEAAEALLELATGGSPQPQPVLPLGADPFAHPDAQRRFRTLANVEELAEALDYPWDRWAIFLHPAQQDIVDRDYSGAARVSGSAGTGKTVVALHRAVALAKRHPDAQVLLTTFSPTLASLLRSKVRRLLAGDPRIGERLEVADLGDVAKRLYDATIGKAQTADQAAILEAIRSAGSTIKHPFTERFLLSEWTEVVDAWQLQTWEEYRDVRRLGRKTRLPENQRVLLWSIFEQVIQRLEKAGLVTPSALFTRLAEHVQGRKHPPFEFVIVDEAQDVSIPQLKFLAEIGGQRPNALFFAGDLGQRIFQSPFSWKSLGVDVRGRSKTLTINYRTSHQIRSQADRLLGPSIADVDGNVEVRKGTVSVFNGPSPIVIRARDEHSEAEKVALWIKERNAEGVIAGEIGVFVRSDEQLPRAIEAIVRTGLPYRILSLNKEPVTGEVTVCTMHHAKGLEFKAVAVIACDDEIIPWQERIEEVSDDADLEEVYNTERHLLYVAATRARDFLLLSSGGSPSEFLDDFDGA